MIRDADALAVVGSKLATDLVDVTPDLDALDSSGFWAVVLPFEGEVVCARFATVRPARPWPGAPWHGPGWTSTSSKPASHRSGRPSPRATCTRST
jgi:para-aminobenzoate synthetase component 1